MSEACGYRLADAHACGIMRMRVPAEKGGLVQRPGWVPSTGRRSRGVPTRRGPTVDGDAEPRHCEGVDGRNERKRCRIRSTCIEARQGLSRRTTLTGRAEDRRPSCTSHIGC